ncbi:hypothetical protein FRC01_007312 [Tulasnella sp. 417]|nr:hypothetical protein FRC01_007312 [Tulasnella sp. 417]
MKVVTLSMVVLGDIPFWLLDREQAWSALSHVFEDEYDDTILGLMALVIANGFAGPTIRPEEEIRGLVRNACSGKGIAAILLEGVRCGPEALSEKQRPSYIHALPIFTEILQRLGELPSTKAFIELNPETLFADVANLILAVDEIYDTQSGPSSELDRFMNEALHLLRTFKPPLTRHGSMHTIFEGILISFVRCNQGSTSISKAAMETLEWLNQCLSEHDFVTESTISRLMWGLESPELRGELLRLIYTHVSKCFSRVSEVRYKLWISNGLIPQLLEALLSGATTGYMEMVVPLALRHVIKRAKAKSWELQEVEEIASVGITVVNSVVNGDTGALGQAYSLVIFEVILAIWEILCEECRATQMSEGMVGAMKHILLDIEDLFGDKQGTATLTSTLRSKIGVVACPEPLNLSPTVLQKFLSDLKAKKPDIWAAADLDTVVHRVRDLLVDGTTPKAQL